MLLSPPSPSLSKGLEDVFSNIFFWLPSCHFQELKELVTYTAVTLQQSLQEKLVDTHQRLLDNRGQPGSIEQDSPAATSTATKHVRINEGHHRHVRQTAERGDCLECRQVRNRRRPRKERPTSMPPIYVRERGTCDDSPVDTADGHVSSDPQRTGSQREECRYQGMESTQTVPDCSHDCRQTYEAKAPHRRCHCECSGSSRGRGGRLRKPFSIILLHLLFFDQNISLCCEAMAIRNSNFHLFQGMYWAVCRGTSLLFFSAVLLYWSWGIESTVVEYHK